MNKLTKYYFIYLILILFAMPAISQNFNKLGGFPFIKNYSPDEFRGHEKSFEIVQDFEGFMYFANFAGVIEFDGTNWSKIPSSSGMRILSTDIDAKGKVFAGGLYDFGFIERDKKGFTHFVSLLGSNENKAKVGLISKVICLESKSYFFSEKTIFVYDGTKTTELTLDNQALSAFKVNKQIFVLFDTKNSKSNQTGLCIFQDNQFTKVAIQTELPIQNIRFMIPWNTANEIMIGSENQGIYILNKNQLTEFNSPINDFVKKNGLTCGIKSSKSGYAIGTLTGGIAIINKIGEITRLIDRTAKLDDASINSLFLDKNLSLWVTTNNGISKAEINWPLTYIDNKTSGLYGKVQDIEEFENNLYFATDEGIYYLTGSSIKKVNSIDGASLSLLKINNMLFAATSRGIFKIKEQNAQYVENTAFTFCLKKSQKNTNQVYAGQNKKVVVYQVENSLKQVQNITGLPGDVINLIEDKDGDLFMEVSPGKVFLYKSNTKQLVEIESNNSFLSLHLNAKAGKIFLSSEKGLFAVNKSTNKIDPFEMIPGDPKSQQLWIHDLFEISENTNIISNGEQKNLSFLNLENGRFAVYQSQYLPVSSFSIQSFFLTNRNTQLWLGGRDGLLISHFTDLFDFKTNFKTMIRKIRIISKDSVVEQVENKLTKISYADNSLQFEYSFPAFPAMGKVEFRYFLKGFDNDTSNWDILTKKDYTNLPDGVYQFMVEARNEFGNIAPKAEFRFKILTPLYRQWWAFILYLIVFVALIRIYFIWRLRASEKEKSRLEELIKERTEEIEFSKKKIEEQRDIAYKQKKEILDSISYAQKIQQAVLPSAQFVDDILLEHFIYYQPRDIVSGDFYWMKKINNFIAVVAADCTGHGVPGAFMSMLGSSFLNEIVTRRSMDSASQILNRLRLKVKKSLHQEGKDGEQKDGMDIALLIIDVETLILQFSGAYNPLYIIRPQEGININDECLDIDSRYEMYHLKADRQPIGIHLAEKEFTNHIFQLKNGDNLYSFSDGYVDQFGGETGEKFKSKRFKELLMSAQGKPMFEQKQILEQAFVKWKRDLAQIDDVLVMGIKV